MSQYQCGGPSSQNPYPFPLLQVDYIRVTHPCAGRHRYQQADTMLPLDLHVLGLSLAFILSQDQTLRCMISFTSFTQPAGS